MIYIVGLGPGHEDYILPKAIKTLEKSDIVLGFGRAIDSIDFINSNKIKVKKLDEILYFINNNSNKNISIVASGDPGFYGIGDFIKNNFKQKLEIVPGISSFQYMMAELNKSWQNAYLGSLHGRIENLIESVRIHKISIWLTDKKNSPSYICEKLVQESIDAKVYVGQNLSYDDEQIVIGNPKELMSKDFESLSVVVIETN